MDARIGIPARVDLPRWPSVFSTGLILWVASVVVTAYTGNLIMIPTVVLLGSFLVPVTAIVWYLDHYESPQITPRVIFSTFFVGGVLGVLAASVLESWLRSETVLLYVAVGLTEEFAKLLALVFIARRLAYYTIRDGIVLGAAVGFGFGALESSGYALTSLFVARGDDVVLSLSSLVFTELLRGVLAPLGHGLWTAILGGALFGASRGGRLRLTRGVVGAYLLASLLHALWDSMRGIAFVLTELLTATPDQRIALMEGVVLPPTIKQVEVFLSFEIGGLALISVLGFVALRRL
ncbi:MAG TPA: PrsW family glutamic-type intramembrane protease, partial [Candidatus Acidoferrales bacterium]|nr:PrsW family glutamic-type intramembrane protease [Candidatus Acidoferrales bacterium]